MPKTHSLQEYRDRHLGQKAFVCGSGPSLAEIDPHQLKPFVRIAVNWAVFKIRDATYFFSADSNTIHGECMPDFVLKNCPNIRTFFSTAYSENDAIDCPELGDRYEIIEASSQCGPPKIESRHLVKASSSAHLAAQLLWVMGCNPIILIGCDCSKKGSAYSFMDLPEYGSTVSPEIKELMQKNPSRDFNASHVQFWENYQHLPILDASSGAIEVFPKIPLNETLK